MEILATKTKKHLQGYSISLFTHFPKIRFGLHMGDSGKVRKTHEITMEYGNFIYVFFRENVFYYIDAEKLHGDGG